MITLSEVRARLNKVLQSQPGLSMRKLERLTIDHGGCRVSPGYLTQIKNGTQENEISQDVLLSIIRALDWLDVQETQPVPTANFANIMALLQASVGNGSFHIVLGESGYGKTAAFTHYVKTAPDGVVAITAYRGMGLRPLLEELCKAVGIRYLVRSTPHHILMRMADMGIKQIVIDEADQLVVRSLEVLRYLHDRGGTSIVLIGLPALMQRMTVSSDKLDNLAQLFSRVDYRLNLKPPSEDEIGAIARGMGVGKADLVSAVVKNAKVAGRVNLHRVEKLVKGIKETCTASGMSIDEMTSSDVSYVKKDMI